MRLLILAGLLAAAACTTTPPPGPAPAPAVEARSARYLCTDGRAVELLYGGDGSAVLTVGSETVELAPVEGQAGSYSAQGWRWTASGAAGGMLIASGGQPVTCRAAAG